MKFEANPHVSNCPVCRSHDLRKVGADTNSCWNCGSVSRRGETEFLTPQISILRESHLGKEIQTSSVTPPLITSPAVFPMIILIRLGTN